MFFCLDEFFMGPQHVLNYLSAIISGQARGDGRAYTSSKTDTHYLVLFDFGSFVVSTSVSI